MAMAPFTLPCQRSRAAHRHGQTECIASGWKSSTERAIGHDQVHHHRSSTMLIDGFGISGYRSFGYEVQRIGPLSKVNLVIGQNNCGKSNILGWLGNYYQKFNISCRGHGIHGYDDPFDRHLSMEWKPIKCAFGVRYGSAVHNKVLESVSSPLAKVSGNEGPALVDAIFKSPALTDGTDVAWFTFAYTAESSPFYIYPQLIYRFAHRDYRQQWESVH